VSGRRSKPSRQFRSDGGRVQGVVQKGEATAGEGGGIPIWVAHFEVNDDVPSEYKIEDVVRRMLCGKAPGPTVMRAEHFNEWLAAVYKEENPDSSRWDKFVELVKHIFETGQMPEEASWCVLVLIPKYSRGSRGICLLEVVLKFVSSIINSRLKADIQFCDALHGFLEKRDTGTATMEAKLRMQLSHIQQKTLYKIYIDFRKAYDALDRDRTLTIIQGYGAGERAIGILKGLWDSQSGVAR
jgi:hypothetical protein